MPTVNQYIFKPKELVGLLIKAADLHEGRWWLMVNFGMAGGNYGPTQEELAPGMLVAVQGIGLQRDTPENPGPPGLTVDAGELNP